MGLQNPILVAGEYAAIPTIIPISVDANGFVNVNATFSGSISGNAAAGPTGAAVPADADYLGVNIGGNLVGVTGVSLTNAKAATVAVVDGNGNQITSFGGGVQFADNAASGATPIGTLSMGWDSVNSKIRALKVDTSQNLDVNIAANSFGTLTIAGSVSVSNFPATQPVSGTVTANQGTNPWIDDPIDRAGRLLGVVYGSQGQQLKQTATNFNTQVELATGATLYDARQIRALTSSDIVTVVQASGVNLHVDVDNFPATQPVSGTVSVTQSTSPWVENVSQFGGNPIVTGTGTSGVGIPRITISNDSAIKIWDGTNVASVKSLTNSNPLVVEIVDGSGNQITSFGGGTQFADNAASGATPTGTLSMGWDSFNLAVRALKVDPSQNLYVNVVNTSFTTMDDGPVLPGYLAANASLIGAQIQNTGLMSAVQQDNFGNLRVIEPANIIADTLQSLLAQMKYTNVLLALGLNVPIDDFDAVNSTLNTQ